MRIGEMYVRHSLFMIMGVVNVLLCFYFAK